MIYSCNAWELNALLQGMALRQLDWRDLIVDLAFYQRYVDNAKRPKREKMFNRKLAETKIQKSFEARRAKQTETTSITERIQQINQHFMNR